MAESRISHGGGCANTRRVCANLLFGNSFPESPTTWKQECIPVGCIPPAAVAVLGGLHQAHPPGPDPWEQTNTPLGSRQTSPPGADLPNARLPPGEFRPPRADKGSPVTRHPREQAPPYYVNRMTDACENITLPQTSWGR